MTWENQDKSSPKHYMGKGNKNESRNQWTKYAIRINKQGAVSLKW